MGATAVLEIAAEIPPAKKSLAKEMAVSLMVQLFLMCLSDEQYSINPAALYS